MKYQSTRGGTLPLEFEAVLLEGLARDGGLFVPTQWPTLSGETLRSMANASYADVACTIMQPFVGDALSSADIRRIVDEAYATFRHPQVAPLVSLEPVLPGGHLLELYHGPTLAFKDVAMQVLGGLFEHLLEQRSERVTIIGATSGDTGSAAIEAFANRQRVTVFILHPRGRTSEVQRRQMTTVDAPNVFNLAVEGTFDDCQNLVKAMFNDAAFRDAVRMSAVNSINWARLMPQITYYVTAALALHGADAATHPTRFSVPTGNFGDIYAGYAAACMGLPVSRLLIASNENDILTRVMHTGEHALGQVAQTLSPSMDIQVSSNFERLLFDMLGRDGAQVASLMHALSTTGRFGVPPEALGKVSRQFGAYRVDEQQTLDTMRLVHERCGLLIDPHTAVGVAAAMREQSNPGKAAAHAADPWVVLGTAHPAKFPDAVERATGLRPPLPEFMADLYERTERYDVLPHDLAAVEDYVRSHLPR